MDDASCAEVAPDVFFPEPGSGVQLGFVRQICEACPVRVTCLEYAVSERIEFGVWGGLTPSERRRVRRGRS